VPSLEFAGGAVRRPAKTGHQLADSGHQADDSSGHTKAERYAENIRSCRAWCTFREPCGGGLQSQRQVMTNFTELASVPSDRPALALVAMLGLLGLRIFEATGADIADLGEEHGHRVLRVCGKGTKVVLVPLPPAVGRAIDTAIGARTSGPGVDLRDVQISARHADPRTTMHQVGPARTPTPIRTTSWPPTWPPAPDRACVSRGTGPGRRPALPMRA
jgi:hypothetical protein